MGKRYKKKVQWRRLSLNETATATVCEDGDARLSTDTAPGYNSKHIYKTRDDAPGRRKHYTYSENPYNGGFVDHEPTEYCDAPPEFFEQEIQGWPTLEDAEEYESVYANFSTQPVRTVFINNDPNHFYNGEPGSPALAGIVVQQAYPGGPMITIPVHWQTYIDPSFIRGDPALTTLDPGCTRVVNADDFCPESTPVLPLQHDANGVPIMVQVQVDENGVPVEIEPRGFQIYQSSMEGCLQDSFLPPDAPILQNRESSLNPPKSDKLPESDPKTEVNEELSDPKYTEDSGSDSQNSLQYASMSDTSAPTTPAGEYAEQPTPSNSEKAPQNDPVDSVEEIPEIIRETSSDDVKVPEEVIVEEIEEAPSLEPNKQTTTEIVEDMKPKLDEELSEGPSENSQDTSTETSKEDNKSINEESLQWEPIPTEVLEERDFTPVVARKHKKHRSKKSSTVPVTTDFHVQEEITTVTRPPQNEAPKIESKASITKSLKTPKTEKSTQVNTKNSKKSTSTKKKPKKTPSVGVSPLTGNTYSPSIKPTKLTLKEQKKLLPPIELLHTEFEEFLNLEITSEGPINLAADLSTRSIEGFGHIDIARLDSLNKPVTKPKKKQRRTKTVGASSRSSISESASSVNSDNEDSIASSLIGDNEVASISEEEPRCLPPAKDTKSPNSQINEEIQFFREAQASPDAKQKTEITNVHVNGTSPNSEDVQCIETTEELQIIAEESTAIAVDTTSVSETFESEEPHEEQCDIASSEQCSMLPEELTFEQSAQVTEEESNPAPTEEESNPAPTEEESNPAPTEEPEDVKEIPVKKPIQLNPLSQEFSSRFTDLSKGINQQISVESVAADDQPVKSTEEGSSSDQVGSDSGDASDETKTSGQDSKESCKPGYVILPVLTPYYDPAVLYGYSMPVQEEDHVIEKNYSRRRRRKYKKKGHDNHHSSGHYYDVDKYTGDTYVTVQNGYVPTKDSPQHVCQMHGPKPLPNDDGFVASENSSKTNECAPISSDTTASKQNDSFPKLNDDERKEVVEILQENVKPESTEGSGLSERDDANQNSLRGSKTSEQTKNSEKKESELVARTDKSKRKQKTSKPPKNVVHIEEPDFSKPNTLFTDRKDVVLEEKTVPKRNFAERTKRSLKKKNKNSNKNNKQDKRNKSQTPQISTQVSIDESLFEEPDIVVTDNLESKERSSISIHSAVPIVNSDNQNLECDSLLSSKTLETEQVENHPDPALVSGIELDFSVDYEQKDSPFTATEQEQEPSVAIEVKNEPSMTLEKEAELSLSLEAEDGDHISPEEKQESSIHTGEEQKLPNPTEVEPQPSGAAGEEPKPSTVIEEQLYLIPAEEQNFLVLTQDEHELSVAPQDEEALPVTLQEEETLAVAPQTQTDHDAAFTDEDVAVALENEKELDVASQDEKEIDVASQNERELYVVPQEQQELPIAHEGNQDCTKEGYKTSFILNDILKSGTTDCLQKQKTTYPSHFSCEEELSMQSTVVENLYNDHERLINEANECVLDLDSCSAKSSPLSMASGEEILPSLTERVLFNQQALETTHGDQISQIIMNDKTSSTEATPVQNSPIHQLETQTLDIQKLYTNLCNGSESLIVSTIHTEDSLLSPSPNTQGAGNAENLSGCFTKARISTLNSIEEEEETSDAADERPCSALGVTAAVKEWMCQVPPNEITKLFFMPDIPCSSSDDTDYESSGECDSKNGQGNPLAAPPNEGRISSDGVATKESDLILNNGDGLDVTDDLSGDPRKYDPSFYSKYYNLGVQVDKTPECSGRSSRSCSQENSPLQPDGSNGHTQHNHSMSLELREDSLPSFVESRSDSGEKCRTVRPDGVLSPTSSSGLGSSLASTPFESPSRLLCSPTDKVPEGASLPCRNTSSCAIC